MDVLKRIGDCGIVPVVVVEESKNAVPAARALLAGEIGVMEITLRTKAALDSIQLVKKEVPEMLVGAGTVLDLSQTKQAVEAGAEFIVSPGFNKEQVQWCLEKGITVIPACATPTEILKSYSLGIKILKFFPANVYGGLSALKSLVGPFGDVKFIPTGGVDQSNLGEFSAAPYVHAVGGSWVCSKNDIAEGKFGTITQLCKSALEVMHGFEFAHLGINSQNAEVAGGTAEEFNKAFMFPIKDGPSSVFAGSGIEVVKTLYLGAKGHIAVRTNNVERAVVYLEKKGFSVNHESAKSKNGRMSSVYLKGEIGGFAVHLLQK